MGYRLIIGFGAFLLLVSGYISYAPKAKKIGDNPYNLSPLQKAYLLGDKSSVSRSHIKIHKNLGIMHFMTPSGLHLSTLLIIISLLFRTKVFSFWISLFLLFALFDINHLDSFKRMCFFNTIKKNPILKINNKQSFLLTFIYYFISGQYFDNPLSFSLSFLFLSILIFSSNRKETFYSILLIQMLISFYFSQDYYLIGSLFGLMLTFSSVFIFPLILIEALFSLNYFTNIWTTVLENLNEVRGPELPSFIFFILISSFFLKSQRKLKILCAIISIFMPIEFKTTYKSNINTSPPPQNFINKKEKNNTIFVKYESGLECKSKLKVDQWYTRCHK